MSVATLFTLSGIASLILMMAGMAAIYTVVILLAWGMLRLFSASGIETQSAMTAGHGPQDESPVGKAETPKGHRP